MEDSNDVPADSNDSTTNAKASQDGRTDAVKRPVGLAVLVMVVVLLIPVGLSVAAIAPWTVTRPIVTCTELRSAETGRSQDLLKLSLTETIATTKAELDDIRSKNSENDRVLGEDERELESAQADLESSQAELIALNAESGAEGGESGAEGGESGAEGGESDTEGGESDTEGGESDTDASSLDAETIASLTERIAALTGRIAFLDDRVDLLLATIETLDQRRGVLLARFEAKFRARSALLTPAETEAERLWVISEIAELRAFRTVDGKDRERLTMMRMILDESINGRFAFPAPRSNVNLVPAVSVVHIDLGSHRFPTRVEVALENLNLGNTEDVAALTTEASAVVISNSELPEKAEFLAEAGQLRRTEGIAIPAQEVMVWARRLGNFVMLSVCISPDGLDPGQYAGDVYLLDPSLNPTKVHVEVTAQSVFINWLYVLLFLVPASALFYVWVNSRYTAGESPWKWRPFWNWLSQNAVIALVVGFAAVWAALQGPFNNPTWGSSLVGAVVVIGVGLVAAMTAMTVVAGRADQKGIDSPDKGDRGDDGVAVPGDKSDDLNQGS